MGCVFGREVSAKPVEREEEREKVEEEIRVSAKAELREIQANVNNARNGGSRKEVEDGGGQLGFRPRGERRRSSRPNPRSSNLPKHVHGEQVAAGWPSWLSAVAGEAINGWIPRRADSFEKLDKVGFLIFLMNSFLLLLLLLYWTV